MEKDITTIKTDRLLLRAIVASDIENVYAGLSHPLVIRHYGVSYDSLDATTAQMRWYGETQQVWWAICSPDNETFYGAGGLNNWSAEHRKAEIGLWLLPEYWGKGIMSEVLPLICQYGFDTMGLHRIEGFIDTKNENCKRAMAKLDFDYEGTMQDCEFKDEKYLSIEVYAKLNR